MISRQEINECITYCPGPLWLVDQLRSRDGKQRVYMCYLLIIIRNEGEGKADRSISFFFATNNTQRHPFVLSFRCNW